MDDYTFYRKKSDEYIILVEDLKKKKPIKVDLDFSNTIGIFKDDFRDVKTPVRAQASICRCADGTLMPVSILEENGFFEPLSSWFPELALE